MKKITTVFKNYLKELNAQFEYSTEDELFIVDKIFDISTYRLLIKIYEEKFWFTCYALFPDRINKKNEKKLIDHITKINNEIIIGNFIYSYETNILKFKNSVDLEGIEVTRKILNNLIMCSISMIEQYEVEIKHING